MGVDLFKHTLASVAVAPAGKCDSYTRMLQMNPPVIIYINKSPGCLKNYNPRMYTNDINLIFFTVCHIGKLY